MSSRSFSYGGDGQPSSGYGVRTPLRSLDNETLPLSSPMLKSKSHFSSDVKMKATVIAPCDQDSPPNKPTETNSSLVDTNLMAHGCGDVTLKSFICAGGEVEISGSSECAEEIIVLPKDATTCHSETEETITSDSVIEQSFSGHTEHPYCSCDVKESRSYEIPNTGVSFCDVDDRQAQQDLRGTDCSGEELVTWRSILCDGGEVEDTDATRLQNETILLPMAELGDPSQDKFTNSVNFSDGDPLSQVEHSDHPLNENGIIPAILTLSETTYGSENPSNRLNDLTFKSFNCTGGEIEISQGSRLTDETVPLPVNQTNYRKESCMDPSILADEDDLQCDEDHLDHPYCDVKADSLLPLGNISTAQESFPRSSEAVGVEQTNLMVPENQECKEEHDRIQTCFTAGGEIEKLDDTQVLEKTSSLPEECGTICPPLANSVLTSVTQDWIQDDNDKPDDNLKNPDDNLKNAELVDTDLPAISGSSLTNASLKALEHETVEYEIPKTSGSTILAEECAVPSAVLCGSSLPASSESPAACEAQQGYVSPVRSTSRLTKSSEAKDSALGSSTNAQALCNSAENPPVEILPDVFKVLSECTSGFKLGILSPILRRASLSTLKALGDSPQDKYLADDSALEGEKSLVATVNVDPVGLWAENLESSMPRPLFNSTALGHRPHPGALVEQEEDSEKKNCAVSQSEAEKQLRDIQLNPEGQLQQQLRQMAEFLILASGKMGPGFVPASGPPPAASMAPSQSRFPVKSHSICVGTSPVKLADHSLNTSGVFERKREFSVVDSCTATDPLCWNLPSGVLECLPRQELEQRLNSSMIMVEALVQQLAAARSQGCLSAGPGPSDLREKLVQTDHTELSQTTMYRELYMEALSRIGELELDEKSLQNLKQHMEDVRIIMASLTSDTDAALTDIKAEHQNLVSHYEHTKSLFEKSKETQMRMMQKVKEVLHQKDVMKTQMEEAFSAKEAAFAAMEQLRRHSSTKISALEESIESQQELLVALKQTYPEQVALNKECTETLNSASDLLSQTMDEHSSLANELCTVRGLVQKTAPILLMLNEKAAAAVRERDEHISARNQAFEEQEQIEEELNETNLNLQDARQQIGDLNLQVTILTSEMGVLREKLTEKDEETGQLERKVTELSATVSSTLASYTFLEQALAAETTKLQQSWKDIQQANNRANQMEASLGESDQRVCELSQALADSNEQLGQLQTLSQSQSLQIQQLQDACTQLSGVREMNEFLQMENELAREQMAESEQMLRTNLQSLRQRNIQCEDLKGEVCKLQLENINLRKEVETTRSAAEATRLELEEKMAQAVTEITLLHHTLRGLTNELHAALDEQEPDAQKDEESASFHNVERHPASFVDNVMEALTAEKEEDVKPDTPAGSAPPDVPEPQTEPMFSETSAFTRIAAVNPKQNLDAVNVEEEVEQSSVAELLSGLGCTVKELVSMLKLVQQRKDTQLQELHNTICGLQVEQEAASNRHEAEVLELKHQLRRLNNLVERGNQALQQKAQDEKTLTKLMMEVQRTHEIINKHKTDSNEIRKEVTELRRALQQSTVETQFLRGELRKAGGQSANPAHYMEEKIQLLKEVERLKASLLEVEQARMKLLERAKRHQIIFQTNQQKSENELQILNNMINKVRETLLSLPDVVKNCEPLQQLVEYIG